MSWVWNGLSCFGAPPWRARFPPQLDGGELKVAMGEAGAAKLLAAQLLETDFVLVSARPDWMSWALLIIVAVKDVVTDGCGELES